jgi:hypothetical protein
MVVKKRYAETADREFNATIKLTETLIRRRDRIDHNGDCRGSPAFSNEILKEQETD